MLSRTDYGDKYGLTQVPVADGEEKAAMDALLRRHPAWGTRPISMAMCLRCKAIPQALKHAYRQIMFSRYPTSYHADV